MVLRIVFLTFSQDKSQPRMKGNSLQIEVTCFDFHFGFYGFFFRLTYKL